MKVEPRTVLLVEDNHAEAVLFQEMLAQAAPGQFDFCWVDSLREAVERVENARFDAILLDLSLPDSFGLETIRRVCAAAPAMPMLVLTGSTDERIAAEAVHCGAEDYLIKGQTDARSIARAIHYAIERKQVEKALRAARDELEQRVAERTAALAETVERLHEEIRQRIAMERSLEHERQTLQLLLRASDHERQLIAYEIHDDLAQQLVAAVMHLQAAEGKKPGGVKAHAEASAGLILVQGCLDEARRLISDVRPPILDERGIEAAIMHLICGLRGPDAPRIEFFIDATFGRLDPFLENAIYRITQESLTNACKYSRTAQVRVDLIEQENGTLHLEIQDWGVGFDPHQVSEGRFGLEGIRERARLLGGRATIESTPGEGTRVIAELPVLLPREPAGDQVAAADWPISRFSPK